MLVNIKTGHVPVFLKRSEVYTTKQYRRYKPRPIESSCYNNRLTDYSYML